MKDWLHFATRLARNPRAVGAIAPSGARLARLMAAEVALLGNGRVLELGPGTGSITRALVARGIAPERIVAIEADPRFARTIAKKFPGITVIQGDAFDLKHLEGDEPFDAVISGIPLRNFPGERGQRLIEGMLARLPAHGRFVQFSYGLRAPVKRRTGLGARLAGTSWRNVPPARVWVYHKAN